MGNCSFYFLLFVMGKWSLFTPKNKLQLLTKMSTVVRNLCFQYLWKKLHLLFPTKKSYRKKRTNLPNPTPPK